MRSLFAGVAIFLLASTGGCGDEVIVVFSTSFGTIIGDPDCPGGQFDLRDQEGLIVIVLLDSSSTIILANNSPGACSDLGAGLTVRVTGERSGSRITASEVRVQ
jgi:hypothetical protein